MLGFIKNWLDDNAREVKKLQRTVDQINNLETKMKAMPEAGLIRRWSAASFNSKMISRSRHKPSAGKSKPIEFASAKSSVFLLQHIFAGPSAHDLILIANLYFPLLRPSLFSQKIPAVLLKQRR